MTAKGSPQQATSPKSPVFVYSDHNSTLASRENSQTNTPVVLSVIGIPTASVAEADFPNFDFKNP